MATTDPPGPTEPSGPIPAALPAKVGQPSPITMAFEPRSMKVHAVLDSELTALKDAGPAAPIAFFTMFFGAAVAFGIVVFSQKLPTTSHASFLGLFYSSTALMLFFLVRSLLAIRKSSDIIGQIRERDPVS